MKKGDILQLTIDKYAFEGKGIAKINMDDKENYVVFVDHSYPGDVVDAKLTKIKKSYAEAKTVNLIKSSDFRIKKECIHFGICGGCKQQDLDYKYQLFYKAEQVKDIFERLGGFKEFEFLEILPSPKTFFYRNKMEFSFAEKSWLTEEEIASGKSFDRNFALGLHIPGMFDKVLDITGCYLQSDKSNKILNFTKEFFKSRNTSIYTTKTHSGYLRNLVIRESLHTNDLMVNLVTSVEDDELMKEYSSELLKVVPSITTIINNINQKKAMVAAGDYEIVYHGEGYIYDKIGELTYRISANSFFQTNTIQAKNLYDTILEFAEFKGDEVVYDLYSGAGTISLYVADKVKEVYGFETVDSSIKDAADNEKRNNISNVKFVQADLYKSFLPYLENIPSPDVVILDPPRSGMHANTVNDVIQINPREIVYVSCNPATQVRDIKLFEAAGYKLIKIRPVDMFPHTYHIENVALLIKRK